MTATLDDLGDRLENIELAQQKTLASVTKTESRVDMLRQEFLRAVTLLYRLKVAADGTKAAAERRDRAIDKITGRLAEIEERLPQKKQAGKKKD